MSEVLFAETGATATITLNRPQALNAFNKAARLDFIFAMKQAEAASGVRALVIHGAGRGFSAGVDLNEAGTPGMSTKTIIDEEFNPGILAITRIAKPVICALHGFASGIGVGFVLACDLVVMGDQSFMQLPFASISLVPDGGICWQLVRRVGLQRAFEMAVDGERIPAARCLELGLVNKVVPEAEVLEAAQNWAARLAVKAPLALAAAKQAMRAAASLDLESVMALESRLQQACGASEDAREGITAFLQKRSPQFKGR
jgi:2-(1,2-epoxy-1,2-dihydrophenyl)acetyl-CoA isomerase